ncbi:MAG: isocitrate lyase/PEP mutase family protein [Desulfobacterales bacterium]
MTPAKNLRSILKVNDIVAAPGAYDALTAKIIEDAGFKAVYMTGYGTSAAHFGLPDLGFLTMTEMVENAARIADAIGVPLIADADTGYGNPMNVVRTVQAYEKAGASAIHIEDQVWPKRCGHMSGKKVVAASDMVEKLKAAVDARNDPDFLIIARTDSIATHGFDHAVERAHLYAEAGADVMFVEAPRTKEDMANIPKLVPEKPHLVNMAPLTPNLGIDELKAMGFSIVLYPGVCLTAAITACMEEVGRIARTGKQRDFQDVVNAFTELNTWLKTPDFIEMEQKYNTD